MKVFGIKFPSKWVGGSAVVVAPHKKHAIKILQDQMEKDNLEKLHEDDFHVQELSIIHSGVIILADGDY